MRNFNKNKLKILIPNATSPRNIGDLAMLDQLLTLIKENLPTAEILIHSMDPKLHKNIVGSKVKHTLYSWAVFSNTSTVFRIARLFQLLAIYLQLCLGSKRSLHFCEDSFRVIIKDYQTADLIIFAGGGYLRSKKGLKQSLNLLMHLIMFQLASLFSAPKIIAPISFGPFARHWQEHLAALTLKRMGIVTVREDISFNLLKKYGLKNISYSADHALLRVQLAKVSPKDKVLGFTLRDWLSPPDQIRFESGVSKVLGDFIKKTGWSVQPILQVDAAKYGEHDRQVTKRIIKSLMGFGKLVLPLVKITSLDTADKIYGRIGLLLGMRMHSNIIAATNYTPFVSIGYEYKSKGIASKLGFARYCIDCNSFDTKKLSNLLIDAYQRRQAMGSILRISLKRIHQKEYPYWARLLKTYDY